MKLFCADRAALAGHASLIIGIGCGRYGYTALLPALILAGQLTPSEGGYTAAANLAGYVLGALSADFLTRRFPVMRVLRAALLAVIIGLALSALPLTVGPLSAARFAVGIAAGIIMASGASVVLSATPPSQLSRTAGILFSGVGIGIALSAIVIPYFANRGPTWGWLGAAGLALLFLPLAWSGWPLSSAEKVNGATANSASEGTRAGRLRGPALFHLLAYLTYGVALMPHTLFWVDFIARELDKGLATGAACWAIAGVGAALGAAGCGIIGRRFGLFAGLIVAFLLFALGLLLPVLSDHIVALAVSSFLFGMMVPGIPALISGRVREFVPAAQFPAVWGLMTAGVSIGQGVGGYLVALIFDLTQAMTAVFAVGAGLLVLSALLCVPRGERRQQAEANPSTVSEST